MQRNLKDLVEKINWAMLPQQNGRHTKLKEDQISLGLYGHKHKAPFADSVRLKFGKAVIALLGWFKGDKICIMHDPDDLLSFMMVKSESKNGSSTLAIDPSGNFVMQFKWSLPINILTRPVAILEHHIYRQKTLLFRIPGDKD